MVWALEAVFDGHMARGQIDQHRRNGKRRQAARTLFMQDDRAFIQALQAADPRADQDAGAVLIFIILRNPAGIFDGLLRRGHAVADEHIHLLLFLGRNEKIDVEIGLSGGGFSRIGHFARDLRGDIGGVKMRDPANAAFASGQ